MKDLDVLSVSALMFRHIGTSNKILLLQSPVFYASIEARDTIKLFNSNFKYLHLSSAASASSPHHG